MSNQGIDYGMGQTNIDKETGIRYGVIHQNEVMQIWSDSSEAVYGDPTCPECGSDVVGGEVKEYFCKSCNKGWDNDDVWPEEPNGYEYNDGGYTCQQNSDGDIFILKSPYYTRCQFCSPCAPGAGYLMNEVVDGVKAYCFDFSWFDKEKAPYKVFRVEDDSEVLPEKA